MPLIPITSDNWLPVVSGSTVDTIVQFTTGGLFDTGAEPTQVRGISVAPMEKIVFPAGVDVYARSVGAPEGSVFVAGFGA